MSAELLSREAGVDQIAQGHLCVGHSLKLEVKQDLPTIAATVGEEEHVRDTLVELVGEEFVGQLAERGEVDPGGQVGAVSSCEKLDHCRDREDCLEGGILHARRLRRSGEVGDWTPSSVNSRGGYMVEWD